MNYKVFIIRDKKLWTIQKVANAETALNLYKVCIEEIETKSAYYTAGHVYFILLYYKNKRIKMKKIDKRSWQIKLNMI